MKPLVIYHNNCADGFGAAFAAWLKFGYEVEYYPMQYGFEEVPDFKGRDVYMLDFSWPENLMDDLITGAKRVVWLDHHKTAFEMWCPTERELHKEDNERVTITLDNNKSGALLAWEHFFPAVEPPMLFKHLDDYDRWQFKMEGTKAFNKALWAQAPWSFEQWEALKLHRYPYPSSDYLAFVEKGEAILKAHDANVKAVVKDAARKCTIVMPGGAAVLDGTVVVTDVRRGLAANCLPHLQSDVGYELAKRSGTFGLLWHINKDGKCLCSLRSTGDYDVSAIAKAFGGGGHKNAAGFEVDISVLLQWIS